jgi:hypothetical protein
MDLGAEATARLAQGVQMAPPFMARPPVLIRSDNGAVDHLNCAAFQESLAASLDLNHAVANRHEVLGDRRTFPVFACKDSKMMCLAQS